MKRMVIAVVGLVAVLVLGGCAQTSQQLRLAPDAEVEESSIGEGHEVAVRVVDEREDKRLGELENRDGSSGELTSATEPRYILLGALEKALEANGFTIAEWDREAERRLEVKIVELEHRVSDGVPRDVSTRIELRSEAVRGDSRLTGTATARDRDRISYRPSAEDNAAYLDRVIGRALGRVVNVDLLDFLASES